MNPGAGLRTIRTGGPGVPNQHAQRLGIAGADDAPARAALSKTQRLCRFSLTASPPGVNMLGSQGRRAALWRADTRRLLPAFMFGRWLYWSYVSLGMKELFLLFVPGTVSVRSSSPSRGGGISCPTEANQVRKAILVVLCVLAFVATALTLGFLVYGILAAGWPDGSLGDLLDFLALGASLMLLASSMTPWTSRRTALALTVPACLLAAIRAFYMLAYWLRDAMTSPITGPLIFAAGALAPALLLSGAFLLRLLQQRPHRKAHRLWLVSWAIGVLIAVLWPWYLFTTPGDPVVTLAWPMWQGPAILLLAAAAPLWSPPVPRTEDGGETRERQGR